MKKVAVIIVLLFMGLLLKAQVVTTSPAFPVDGSGSVTVYFHADQGNQGLLNFTGSVFIYTGVVLSTHQGAWSNVVTTWGAGNTTYRMTRVNANTYSYTIPNLRSFYGVTGATMIDSLALLFTDSLGTVAGRNTGGADIFYKVIQPGTFVGEFLTPDQFPVIVTQGTPLSSLYECSQNSTISVYQNGTLLNNYTNSDSILLSLSGTPGNNKVKAVANNGSVSIADSFNYFVIDTNATVAALPAGLKDGINYINDSTVTLVLVAPHKSYVFIVGEFNNWSIDTAYSMYKTPDTSRFWKTITHLTPQHQYAYQYLVDGTIKVADPYTEEVLDPANDPYIPASVYPGLKAYPTGLTTGIVSTLQTAMPSYSWQATNYQKPDKHNLVVYELLIRDFLADHNYHSLIDTIAYLKNLGVNAIELMPVSEFEGNISWGYNPNFYFAPDKYYGPADSLRAFIDLCHQNNIAVIMDFVFNHSFSTSPMCQLYWDNVNQWPAANNPWYNTDCDPTTPGYQGKHPDGVGFDVNHESPYTKKFFIDAVRHWVKDYHMDGYRFDLAKGYTQFYSGNDVNLWGQYDQSRINIWEQYADSMWALDPSTYVILEHFAVNSEQTVLANYGMMLWGNMSYAYEQSAMGYATSGGDISGISYQALGWDQPNLVGYMESHDEERVMYKCEQYGNANGTYVIKNTDIALDRVKLNAAFFFTIPGPKLFWQFGELGYDTSINGGGSNVAPKPILWNYETVPARASLYNVFRKLIYLKTQYPAAFNTSSYTLNVGSVNLRSIYLNDPSMQAVVIGNFDVNPGTIGVMFQHTGWWYEYFTGDSINVTSTAADNILLDNGEYRLYTSQRIDQPPPVLGTPQIVSAKNDEVHLYQNFPNPFSHSSTVDLSLPGSMHATIEIFDVTGNLVDVVTDKDFPGGNYNFDLDAQRFKSGIYYLTLITSTGSKQTISFTVVK